MIDAMAHQDSGDRWSLTVPEIPDTHLAGTRIGVLAWSEHLDARGIRHDVHRRPNPAEPWQLAGTRRLAAST